MEYKEEYKELFEAADTEETTETLEETEIAEATEVAEDTVTTEETVVEPVSKKKFPLQTPIIIAACILVAAIIGFFAINLFTPTVEGSWKYESEEGYTFYYTFDEKADTKECVMSFGTVYFPGFYEETVGEESNTVSVSLYTGYINGNYTYSIEGNKLFKNRVMTLTAEDGTVITLTQAKEPKDKDYIQPDENFTPVEELIGEWEFVYEEYGVSYKLSINDDGTMSFNQFDLQEIHFVYTADESVINLSYCQDEVTTQEEEYYFEGDQLIFMGLNWSRVGESTADQA
ncbi:MAG: hypothetical protein IJE16_04655 [Ruminococcus sp.]|nr:hypothetical protein [Ruminococcus sp.]